MGASQLNGVEKKKKEGGGEGEPGGGGERGANRGSYL